MGVDRTAVREQLSVVVEDDNTVAQQSPALFWVERHEAGRIVIGSVRGWTRWLVLTHCRYLDLPWMPVVRSATSFGSAAPRGYGITTCSHAWIYLYGVPNTPTNPRILR